MKEIEKERPGEMWEAPRARELRLSGNRSALDSYTQLAVREILVMKVLVKAMTWKE